MQGCCWHGCSGASDEVREAERQGGIPCHLSKQQRQLMPEFALVIVRHLGNLAREGWDHPSLRLEERDYLLRLRVVRHSRVVCAKLLRVEKRSPRSRDCFLLRMGV